MKNVIIDAVDSGKKVSIKFDQDSYTFKELTNDQPIDDNFVGFKHPNGSSRYINLSKAIVIGISE